MRRRHVTEHRLSTAFLTGFLLGGVTCPALAETAWGARDAEQLTRIVPECSGGVFNGEVRDAQKIATSLPKPGELLSAFDEQRAKDTYLYAGALLKPSIPDPERALDRSSFVKCPPDPVLGLKLMAYLAGDAPGENKGPTNSFYWLGMAYRRGIGTVVDPDRARSHFLHARILGMTNLTAEDWGASPTEQLFDVLNRPDNRRWLEAAAAKGLKGAMVLLAELIIDQEPARAQTLLAAQPNNIIAARKFAEFELEGRFGEKRPEAAVAALAYFGRLLKSDYELMLKAANQYNNLGGDLPVSARTISLNELGGPELLDKLVKRAKEIEIDSIRGVVKARALVDPSGKIIYTEVPDPQTQRFRMASATIELFASAKLGRLPPLVLDGRSVFHWVDLPPVRWAARSGGSLIEMED